MGMGHDELGKALCFCQRCSRRRVASCRRAASCSPSQLVPGDAQIGKIIGARWKALDTDEKKPYIDLAEKDKVGDVGGQG